MLEKAFDTLDPGSSLASLWLRVNQDNQPPASVPSTLNASDADESFLSADEFRELLEQAAAESLKKLKRRKKPG